MEPSGFESGRQYEIDPVSGQRFYREPIESFYPPCTTLEPLDQHLPRLAGHNVGSCFESIFPR